MQLNRRGRPSVEVITEQFAALASAIIKANKLPDSTAVMIPGNPEYVSYEKLIALADHALDEIVDRLTDSGKA